MYDPHRPTPHTPPHSQPHAPGGPLLVSTRLSWRGVGMALLHLVLALVGLTVIVGGVAVLLRGEWQGVIGVVMGVLIGVVVPANGLMSAIRRRPGRVLLRLDADGVTTASTWPSSGLARPLQWFEVAGCCLFSVRQGVVRSADYIAFFPTAGMEAPPTRRELAASSTSGAPPIALRYALRIGAWTVPPEEVVRAATQFAPHLRVVDTRG
ncbi:hypothetical protein CLV63_1047 [Murinocardiopsis flavida]|uniref:PH (Pleckstrin Homology) domain-containing protein n=1 Tax=Murinocardiopsis flavida TaxID=645275 RepID=A0A2P8DNL9_9ACTN|nr:hypothetical protein [Murinocardiopsis flavida]PSK98783.1 hypothetical protein CLV63_1047 [Murinocardiopsis flavida]